MTIIVSKLSNTWTLFANSDNQKEEHDLFKLHLRFDFTKIPNDTEKTLQELLINAAQEGIIPAFKCLNVEAHTNKITKNQNLFNQSSREQEQKELTQHTLKTEQRYQILPYTIYLYDSLAKNNFIKIAELCMNIETLLLKSNLPLGEDTHLCDSDVNLLFFRHVMCRQTQLSKQEKLIAAFDKRAPSLRKACQNSQHFSTLKKAVQDLAAAKMFARHSSPATFTPPLASSSTEAKNETGLVQDKSSSYSTSRK